MTSIYNKYIFDLPIIPKVVAQIVGIPNNSNISSTNIEDILKIDAYLTCRILKVANSSYYSREREITSIKDAVTLIGLKKIKTICLLIAGSEIISNKNDDFYIDFWKDSINTAFIAQSIAENTGKSVISEDIFTSGILHNIGQAILFNFSNKKYKIVQEKIKLNKRSIKEIELEIFGITNHNVASGVLNSWEFPQLHIDVVENYLNPAAHSKFQNILDIISIAKLINLKYSNNTLYNSEKLLLTYQSRLNLRNSDIDYYIHSFIDQIKGNNFYKSCYEALSI